MKKQYKKIIAREFLILLTGIVLFLILLLGWIKIHDINQSKEYELENEISEIVANPLTEKLKSYVREANSGNFNTEQLNSKFPELKKYGEQVLLDYIATVNSGKYKTITEVNQKFPEFGYNQNGLLESTNEKDYLEKKEKLEKIRNSFWNSSISESDTYDLAFILLCILFFSRYLIYAIIWSVKQLKE